MNGLIIVSDVITASNTDVLTGTRLSPAPNNGILTFEIEADLASATNQYRATIQLPNGQVPMESVLVPAQPGGVGGVLDDREKIMVSLPIAKGGNVIFQLAETGAAICTYRVTFTPAA